MWAVTLLLLLLLNADADERILSPKRDVNYWNQHTDKGEGKIPRKSFSFLRPLYVSLFGWLVLPRANIHDLVYYIPPCNCHRHSTTPWGRGEYTDTQQRRVEIVLIYFSKVCFNEWEKSVSSSGSTARPVLVCA